MPNTVIPSSTPKPDPTPSPFTSGVQEAIKEVFGDLTDGQKSQYVTVAQLEKLLNL